LEPTVTDPEDEERKHGLRLLRDHVSHDIRRMSNLLAVGNGTALLVIFNARLQHAFTFATYLWPVPFIFAAGLLASFWAQHIIYRHDLENVLGEDDRIRPDQAREATQTRRRMAANILFWGSAWSFVIGLLISILLVALPSV
jgi:hypothetical protein